MRGLFLPKQQKDTICISSTILGGVMIIADIEIWEVFIRSWAYFPEMVYPIPTPPSWEVTHSKKKSFYGHFWVLIN